MAKTSTPKPPKTIITDDPLIRCCLNAIPSPSDEIRGGVSCGEHEVDFDLTVHGELRVGPDCSARQVNKLRPWSLVKLLADKLPDQVVQDCLDEGIRAMLADTDVEGADDLKGRTEANLEQVMPCITVIRKGSVRFHGVVRAL